MGIHHIDVARAACDVASERVKLRALRAGIMAQIDADLRRVDRMIRALDLMDGDPDLEPDADSEDGHDAEGLTDDTGLADQAGLEEQMHRAAEHSAGLCLVQGGRA